MVHEEAPTNSSSGGGGGFAAFMAIFLFIAVIVGNYVFGWRLPILPGGGTAGVEAELAPGPPPDIAVEAAVPGGMRPCATNWNPGSNEACKFAKNYAAQKVTDSGQRKCLDELWHNESNWDAWADNPTSDAVGIPQSILPLHNYPYKAGEWKKQVDWGLAYIAGRYKTPCAALAFWKRTDPRPHPGHWY